MLKSKRILYTGLAIVLCLLFFFVFRGSGGAVSDEIIVDVSKGQFVVDVTTTGELEAKSSTNIMGPTGLRNYRVYNVNIQEIIDEGTYVEKGQFVARLDPSELTTRLKDTQLEAEQKESEYIQTQLDTTLQMRQARDELVNLAYAVEEKGLIVEQSQFEPPATIKQAEIEQEKAKRALEQKKENYNILKRQNVAKMQGAAASRKKISLELQGMKDLQSNFVITAPESGMLIYRKGWDGKPIKAGSQISAWDPVVATLPDLSSMNSITYVNEVDIRRIAEGQKVEIGLDAFPDKRLAGLVTRVANVGEQRPNSDAKVFQIAVELDKVDDLLRPGMTTSNKIYTSVIEDALSIPLECLHNFQDTVTYVYKRDGLGYSKQEVQVGQTNANAAQILLGVKEGERLYLSIPDEDGKEVLLLPELNGKRSNGNKVQEAAPKPEPLSTSQPDGQISKGKPRA